MCLDAETQALAAHDADVADLAAGFAIERRLVEDDGAALRRRASERLRRPRAASAVTTPSALFRVVAQEFRGADAFPEREPHRFGRGLAGAGPGLARLGPLALHGRSKPSFSTAMPARTQRVLGQIEREAISVIEFEGRLARELRARAEAGGFFVENGEAARQRRAEAGFLGEQRFADERLGAHEFAIGVRPFRRPASRTRRHIKGSSAPSNCAWRMARRMMRRRT